LQAQTAAADRARAAAETADRGKTQFLAAASHDLRQPLHAMGLFAATLSAKVHDRDMRNFVASINASVEALEQLLDALLDISKLDTGAVVHPAATVPHGWLRAWPARRITVIADACVLRFNRELARCMVHRGPDFLHTLRHVTRDVRRAMELTHDPPRRV